MKDLDLDDSIKTIWIFPIQFIYGKLHHLVLFLTSLNEA